MTAAVEEATETAVVNFALEQPAFGQARVSNEMRKRGIFVSPSGVQSIWLHRDLESFKKRLVALERHVGETGEVLTEARVVALERKHDDDTIKGLGRIAAALQTSFASLIQLTEELAAS